MKINLVHYILVPRVSAKRAFIALPKVLREVNMKFRSFFGSFFYIQQTKTYW